MPTANPSPRRAYIVTGPTSGLGLRAALALAAHGTVVLVGRDPERLQAVKARIEGRGQKAVCVVCDLAEPARIDRAVAEIVALNLPLAGLLNNAGLMQMRPTRTTLGWDTTFATDHLGPFALTEALVPHLPDGASVVFVASGVEDPERKPAVAAGFRGGRFISVAASARGEWSPGGSKMPGADAYATSKQCILAAALALAREHTRLQVNAVEPGFTPATALGRDAGPLFMFLAQYVLNLFAPFVKYWSTPGRAGRLLAEVTLNRTGRSGIYYDDRGKPMRGSQQVCDPAFQDRVVAETRAFLQDQGAAQ